MKIWRWHRYYTVVPRCHSLTFVKVRLKYKEWRAIPEVRSERRSRAYSKPMPPSRIGPAGSMRVEMNIALRKRTLSPVILVLEDSSKPSFMLFVVAEANIWIGTKCTSSPRNSRCILRQDSLGVSHFWPALLRARPFKYHPTPVSATVFLSQIPVGADPRPRISPSHVFTGEPWDAGLRMIGNGCSAGTKETLDSTVVQIVVFRTIDIYSQLRVMIKQENRQSPRFLGRFLDSRVSPPQFLRWPADRQGWKALVSRNWIQHTPVSFIGNHLTPQILNMGVSSHPRMTILCHRPRRAGVLDVPVNRTELEG